MKLLKTIFLLGSGFSLGLFVAFYASYNQEKSCSDDSFEDFLTVKDFAKFADVSTSFVYKHFNREFRDFTKIDKDGHKLISKRAICKL